jgi:DMSO/TMAO reductase YedYZ molybdopterin-dependent catalytic subunit
VDKRRDFIKKSLAIGVGLKFLKSKKIFGQEEAKEGLDVLTDRPLTAETPMHLLDDQVTPTKRIFVRNNGLSPQIDIKTWKLKIYGHTNKEFSFSLEDLKNKFKNVTYQLTLECGGNGRAGYFPKTPGNQWSYGAVACPLWTGVRLKDVLEYVGLKKSASFVAYYGHDLHLSGDSKKDVISRGFPLKKALEETTILAFALNSKPLPAEHGYPLRIVCPGYPGSASGKWLKSLWIRDKVHDGSKMTGSAYKVPVYPQAPGTDLKKISEWKIIEQMPIKSLITYPKSDSQISSKKKFICRGFAWTGQEKIIKVDISFDYGQTWIATTLEKAVNKFAWQRWSVNLILPTKGYYEIWARAQDDTNKMQPMVIPGWNPKGYINNAMPRIALNAV